ncbi:SCO2583 family membrane protein [Kitasatospora sp. NBC_01302]|uniref:SCO2583 family membrane protein n=1 Tax=Kitasatospora sp. NBC_01302 TaxID=2903575 RepID=UPI003FA36D47
MGDPGEPPEGAPEGGSGSDDEYRSVVFDESFVKAARITELSASERLNGGAANAIRRRLGPGPFGSLPRQALTLLMLLVLAFTAAVYFGITSPQHEAVGGSGAELTSELTVLTPAAGIVAAADPSSPFGSLAATAGYADGSAGFGLPAAGSSTAHFGQAQVSAAVDLVRRYLEASELAPAVLVQGETTPVRALLAPTEQSQFDQSLTAPSDDQHHAATGWMVRFDPMRTALASDTVKVAGTVRVTEADSGTLELTSDHTLVYAVRPAGAESSGPVSLYTVRRELRFDLSRTDIAAGQLTLADSVVQAGPSSCGAAQAEYLQPLPVGNAGTGTAGPAVVDPADRSAPAWQNCAVMAAPKS